MGIKALDNLPDHLIDHAALGVKSQAQNDSRYVNITGDTMTGDLNFPSTGYVMRDSNGLRWRVTIGTDGAFVINAITSTGEIGTPWLFLFGAI